MRSGVGTAPGKHLRPLDLVIVDVVDADDTPRHPAATEVVHRQHRGPLVLVRQEGEPAGLAC